MAQQAAHDLGRVIHHGNDSCVIDACWSDDTDGADDLLVAVLKGCHHHGTAGKIEQFILSTDEYLEPVRIADEIHQPDHLLAGLQCFEQMTHPLQIFQRGDVVQ